MVWIHCREDVMLIARGKNTIQRRGDYSAGLPLAHQVQFWNSNVALSVTR